MNRLAWSKTVVFVIGLFQAISSFAAQRSMDDLELAKIFDKAVVTRNVEIARIKAKDGRTISVQIPVAKGDTLARTSPSNLMRMRTQMRRDLERQCASGRNPVAQFAMDFAPEAAQFYTAVGLSAGDQMQEDPAYARHFVENSFFDPFGYASFAGYMLGSRGSANLLAMTGLTFDTCRLLKKFGPGAMPRLKPTRLQRLFVPLAGQIANIGGLLINNLVEGLKDPNIKTCAALTIGKVPEAERPKAEIACQTAYEDWVMNGGKLRDMLPDIESMTTVGLALSSPQIATIAAAEGYTMLAKPTQLKIAGAAAGVTLRFAIEKSGNTMIFRGLSMLMSIGRLAPHPAVRVLLSVGNLWAFLHFNDKLKPFFERPAQTAFQGYDIDSTKATILQQLKRSQAQGWTPGKKTLPYCYIDSSVSSIGPVRCVDEFDKPAKAISLLGRKEKKWRDFLMRDAQTVLSNWQGYVLEFANTYTASYKLYSKLLASVAYHATPEGKTYADPFYSPLPLSGLTIDPTKWTTGRICDLPPENVQRFDEAATLLKNEMAQQARPSVVLPKFSTNPQKKPFTVWLTDKAGLALHRTDLNWKLENHPRFAPFAADKFDQGTLQKILDGMTAMNCKLTPTLTDAQRLALYNTAVATLYNELTFGLHNSYHLDIMSPEYQKAAHGNVYMQVNLALGGPAPLPAGVGWLQLLNSDNDTINQDHKALKPTHLGRVKTMQMTDYLLASMVCGPEATPSQLEKIKAANQEKSGWWERTKLLAHGDLSAPNPYTTKNAAEVEKFYNEHKTEQPGIQNLGGILKSDISLNEELGSWKAAFRPPRIVTDLGFDPCSITDTSHLIKQVTAMDGTNSAYVADPHLSVWKINGQSYQGLLEIVKSFARKDVLGQSVFEKWWTTNVQPLAENVVLNYRKSYMRLIYKKYMPVVNNEQFAKNGRPLGLTNAVIESVRDNFEFLKPMVAIGAKSAEVEAELTKLEVTLARRLEIAMLLSGSIDSVRIGLAAMSDGLMPNERASMHMKEPVVPEVRTQADQVVFDAYKANDDQVQAILKAVGELAKNQSLLAPKTSQSNLQTMMKAVMENLTDLVTEVGTYRGLVVSLRLTKEG